MREHFCIFEKFTQSTEIIYKQDAMEAYIWAWYNYGYDTLNMPFIAAKELSSYLTRGDKSFTPLVC